MHQFDAPRLGSERLAAVAAIERGAQGGRALGLRAAGAIGEDDVRERLTVVPMILWLVCVACGCRLSMWVYLSESA